MFPNVAPNSFRNLGILAALTSAACVIATFYLHVTGRGESAEKAILAGPFYLALALAFAVAVCAALIIREWTVSKDPKLGWCLLLLSIGAAAAPIPGAFWFGFGLFWAAMGMPIFGIFEKRRIRRELNPK
jgi:hypothetical protein